jgi:SAM-dependent methyltransferase
MTADKRAVEDQPSTGFDAQAHRQSSLAGWQAAAPGWVRHGALISALGAPVSGWMLDAIAPQGGERVLELAAGVGETGMLAAQLVSPLGGVVISDQAEAMLEGARARAAELELSNVEFQVLNAEWIDLPLASVDAVLCRWGYMLLADPRTALSETRRVLRPGGRLALAVWDAIEHNPWAEAPYRELLEQGLVQPRDTDAPGPFALAERGRVRDLLQDTGFSDIDVDAIETAHRHRTFAVFWEMMLDISPVLHDVVLAQPQEKIEQIRAGVESRLAPYTRPDGVVAIPGRSIVAAASA